MKNEKVMSLITKKNDVSKNKVNFYSNWYNKILNKSNEKHLIASKILELISDKHRKNILEIGMGTIPLFSNILYQHFQKYYIIEKRTLNSFLQDNVVYIQADFENYKFNNNFDVILASHVTYYFNNLHKAIEKMYKLLNEEGCIYFVVNGVDLDYKKIKEAFSQIINKPHVFAYDTLLLYLQDYNIREYSINTEVSFNSFEDLYDSLKLFFDLFYIEYYENKTKIISWLKKNILREKFKMVQKIIKVTK